MKTHHIIQLIPKKPLLTFYKHHFSQAYLVGIQIETQNWGLGSSGRVQALSSNHSLKNRRKKT
jgi:hypothetical protein